MMSSILLNPQLIVYSAALGSTSLFIRISSGFIYGVMAGLFVFYLNLVLLNTLLPGILINIVRV